MIIIIEAATQVLVHWLDNNTVHVPAKVFCVWVGTARNTRLLKKSCKVTKVLGLELGTWVTKPYLAITAF